VRPVACLQDHGTEELRWHREGAFSERTRTRGGRSPDGLADAGDRTARRWSRAWRTRRSELAPDAAQVQVAAEDLHAGVRALDSHVVARRGEQTTAVRGSAGELVHLVTPTLAASILIYRENGTAGVTALLRRAFDHRQIRPRIWYAAIVLLLPGIHALTHRVLRVTGSPLPTLQFPVLASVDAFSGFLVAADFEKLGWSGYASTPMQARWKALQASVLLGLVWAVFHGVALIQHGRSAGWTAWWALSTLAFRVLITWIYNNTWKASLPQRWLTPGGPRTLGRHSKPAATRAFSKT
jgi:membrane protease YdiL (CAAX protease family)